MKTLIIHGSPGSGKTKASRLFEDNNTVYLNGRVKMNPFFCSSCDKTTKTVIIDDIKNKNDLKSFKQIMLNEGNVVVHKQCKSPFEIKLDRLILICDYL